MTANQFDSTLRIITDSACQVTAVHEGIVVGILEIGSVYSLVTRFGKYFIT